MLRSFRHFVRKDLSGRLVGVTTFTRLVLKIGIDTIKKP